MRLSRSVNDACSQMVTRRLASWKFGLPPSVVHTAHMQQHLDRRVEFGEMLSRVQKVQVLWHSRDRAGHLIETW